MIASGGLVAALATGGVATVSAGATDATFTDTQRANGTVQAAQIATPSGFRCYGLGVGLITNYVYWQSANPTVPAPYSYRYAVRDLDPTGTFSSAAPVPSVVIPGQPLLARPRTMAAQPQLLKSGTAIWTGPSATFYPDTHGIEGDC